MKALLLSVLCLTTVVAFLYAQDALTTGAIYGEVLNMAQEVLGGAEIEVLEGPGGVTKVKSRGPQSVVYDGGFFIGDLSPGTYKIQVSHKEYLPQTFDELKVKAGKGTYVIAELRSLTEVTGQLTGSVVVRGAPLGGVIIGYAREGEEEPIETVALEAKGKFSFQRVMPGTYVLVVLKDRKEIYRSEPITVESKKKRKKTIRLKPEMLLERPGWIIGKVTGPDHKPAVRATVTLVKMPEGQRKVTARTDEKGKYKIENLRPGSYLLQAKKSSAEDTRKVNVRSEKAARANFRLKEKK